MLIPHDLPAFGYKKQLARRFDRASQSYDSYAEFQRIVLERLLSLLPTQPADVVVDLGTGTGQALASLSSVFQPTSCVALDLSAQMLSVARTRSSSLENIQFVCADAEQLPFQSSSCDVVFSSLAIQWCLAPEALFEELYRVTKPGGYVIFSTLSQDSMPEIRQAWSALDDKEHVHQYMSIAALLECVSASGWRISSAELSRVPMWFDSAEEAIDSLKKVGASLITSDSPSTMSPSVWKCFLHEYSKQKTDLGIPLSYQVAFVVAQK